MKKTLTLLFLSPLIAFAQAPSSPPRDFKSFLELILGFIDILIPLVVTATLLVFFLGLAKFILAVSGDEKAIDEGKNLMKWGIIGLFVMVSVWGILNLFSTDLFGNFITVPQLPE